jgi:hypothetical protein
MQNTTGGDASFRPDERGDGDRLIASRLVTLIAHVEENMRLIESAIAGETSPGNQDAAAEIVVLEEIVVLDDVTPRYAKAHAALGVCSANLGLALHLLMDSMTAKHGTYA